ncbi:LANO_0F08196g1_1 [Lachancea nothofagi CBS 11611]|uniref:non-specific serine/threonine protein kinase n=1 Tax=Lachancea nothofagi CBS 11611 TaxID=1266666 RepID=A0A1G4K9D3_9SACH|nr:LANO_0F08196g1_1 [Lachancea nothofagi CBS 11611]
MSGRSQHIVGIHYAVGPKIGEGSFGVIFEGENVLGQESGPVAIKFEPRRAEAPQLRDEFRAYKILAGLPGIPRAYYFGQEGMHNVLVIDLLGPSLEDLFEWCGRRFSVKTTCLLAKQMIRRVQSIHERDLIYRDIKPDNFLVAQYQRELPNGQLVKSCAASAHGDPNLVYVVDFGMAKQFRDPKTKQHIPYKERKSLSGTARYMSINTHFGREQSRRDDLESLGHVFFYFLRGFLPWQGLKVANTKLKYEKIGLTKQKVRPEDLVERDIPTQFATYLSYCRSLRFEQEPDYDFLVSLMTQALEENGYEDDEHYDWLDLNNGQSWNIGVNRRANLHGYGNPTPKTSQAARKSAVPRVHRDSYSKAQRLRTQMTSQAAIRDKNGNVMQSYDSMGQRNGNFSDRQQNETDSLEGQSCFKRLCCWCG